MSESGGEYAKSESSESLYAWVAHGTPPICVHVPAPAGGRLWCSRQRRVPLAALGDVVGPQQMPVRMAEITAHRERSRAVVNK